LGENFCSSSVKDQSLSDTIRIIPNRLILTLNGKFQSSILAHPHLRRKKEISKNCCPGDGVDLTKTYMRSDAWNFRQHYLAQNTNIRLSCSNWSSTELKEEFLEFFTEL